MSGAFSTEDLLSWFKSVAPVSSLANKVPSNALPAPRGAVAYQFMQQEREALRREQEQERLLKESSEEEEEESFGYIPDYNTAPDDERAFDCVEDYDIGPGNPTNPKAQPGDDDYAVNLSTDVYEQFEFDINKNPTLPIHRCKEEILEAIENSQVTVIEGSTGSGKSTQVPQFILEAHAQAKVHCNIICTQPRRIAAKSVAKFVSDVQGWPLGQLVGYQIGLDKNVGENTRLTFVTTGVLLQKLVNQRNMNQYTHVILDEVHERDKDTDFSLLVVRKLLRTNSPHVKVILMSATFETAHFAKYFCSRQGQLPPVIKVEGSPHAVPEFYLEDIEHIIGDYKLMDPDVPKITTPYYEMVEKLLVYFDQIESAEDPLYGKGDYVRGTVLVFLPGLPEIMELKDTLDRRNALHLTKLVLHSSISLEEQYRVFLAPDPGKRKVILSTNIAESSITVPDIKYVVDFCLVKQMMCDWSTKYSCLQTVWASQASLNQRKGRAGRVSAGRCYRLISNNFYNDFIPRYSVPEMQRVPIENIVLKCKKLNIGAPKSILLLAIEPPKTADIETAITTLKEVGALTITVDNKVNKLDGNLTFVGRILEKMPIDVRLGKLLVLGHAFGCLESCLVIAAALSLKPFFTRSPLDELTAYRAKTSWDPTCTSDCLAILAAYKAWAEMKMKYRHSRNRSWEVQWCKRNFLSMRILNDVSDLMEDITKRLAGCNIKPTRSLLTHHDTDPDMEILLLKVVLSGAFYPNYFRWGELDEELCRKDMSGCPATNTIKINGLPANPEAYAEQLCSIFSGCGPGKEIRFEAQRAYIEFEPPKGSYSQPNELGPRVLDSVHFALWLKNKRVKPSLVLIDESNRSHNLAVPSAPLSKPVPSLELPDSGHFQILIHHVIDAGHFWAHFSDLRSSDRLGALMQRISSRTLKPFIMPVDKMIGTYCLAQFSGDGLYYRAKILSVNVQKSFQEAEVMFIDYGNTEYVPFQSLCEMGAREMQEPAMAFEVELSGVKSATYPRYSDEANERFRELTCGVQLVMRVYSRVADRLRVELFDTNPKHDVLINEVLVQEGYAIKCDEPYASRVSNAQAKTHHSSSEASTSLLRSAMDPDSPANGHYIPGDPQNRARVGASFTTMNWFRSPKPQPLHGHRLALKGPSSPYEVSFHPMTNFGQNHGVRVQKDSINSVVLNPRPEDKQQRLMVAAHVLLSPSGGACLARDTTLLPPIPGLPHILCLMFAPYVELRCDELKRQYTGALCGLGCDPRNSRSLYPEHDMEITFDTLFTQEDIKTINCVRGAINMSMQNEDNVAKWGEYPMKKLQKNLRRIVSDLVLRPRICVPPYSCPWNDGWNRVQPQDMVYPEQGDEEEEEGEESSQIYPLLNGIAISEQRIDLQRPTRVLLLRKRVKAFKKKIASGDVEPGHVECELCRVTCISVLEMREHLRSERHVFKERELFSDDLSKDLVPKP